MKHIDVIPLLDSEANTTHCKFKLNFEDSLKFVTITLKQNNLKQSLKKVAIAPENKTLENMDLSKCVFIDDFTVKIPVQEKSSNDNYFIYMRLAGLIVEDMVEFESICSMDF
ncbi:hypothetical protein Catovirus_1_188 [Catovirus CTV1]|uniref:Uncharacterized protein n=1 Tax=Catovirus CTV1 TaxID=1977631 RepID=A0A1V0S919_9VIRU|nr:hypothetical protein Catovirus_1_188 [Catovirus CTV1]